MKKESFPENLNNVKINFSEIPLDESEKEFFEVLNNNNLENKSFSELLFTLYRAPEQLVDWNSKNLKAPTFNSVLQEVSGKKLSNYALLKFILNNHQKLNIPNEWKEGNEFGGNHKRLICPGTEFKAKKVNQVFARGISWN